MNELHRKVQKIVALTTADNPDPSIVRIEILNDKEFLAYPGTLDGDDQPIQDPDARPIGFYVFGPDRVGALELFETGKQVRPGESQYRCFHMQRRLDEAGLGWETGR